MSLNSHVETPTMGEFTLENLGLATKDPINADGVMGLQTPDAPTAVINTDMSEGSTGDTTMSSDEISGITDWESKIRIIKDKTDKLVDMKDIQKDIEGSKGMSAEKADAIEATFEGYYGAFNNRAMHTPFESKTNFEKAKAFMNSRIQATTEALVTEFRAVDTNSIAELAKALVETKDFCNEELRDHINCAINKLEAIQVDYNASSIMLPFEGSQFIDMKAVNLINIDIDQLKQGVPVSNEFRLAFNRVKEIWKSNLAVRSTVVAMAEANGHKDAYSVPEYLDLNTIMTGFVAGSSSLAYSGLADDIGEHQKSLDVSAKELANALETGTGVIDVIRNEGMDVLNQATYASISKKNAVELADFAKAATTVVLGLVSLR